MEKTIGVKRVASLLLLSHGLGILAGFVVFYSFFQTQCADLLVARETNYSKTVRSLYSECEARTNHEVLVCQQNLMAEQSALAENHQNLLQAHESTLFQLTSLQSELEKSTAAGTLLKEEITELKLRVEQSDQAMTNTKRWATKQQGMLKEQLALTKTMMQERMDEIEMLKRSDGSACGVAAYNSGTTTTEEDLIQLQAAIRRRSAAQATQRFGEPPYRVQFLLATHYNQSSTSTFEVEFGAIQEMPHTVFTFLNLVEEGLYLGTSIILSSDGLKVSGGNPKDSMQKHAPSKHLRRYAELGYGSEPLLFSEVSLAPCDGFSFGITGRGPNFAILLEESPSEPFSCPGRVADGRDALLALPKNERVTILDARIVTP